MHAGLFISNKVLKIQLVNIKVWVVKITNKWYDWNKPCHCNIIYWKLKRLQQLKLKLWAKTDGTKIGKLQVRSFLLFSNDSTVLLWSTLTTHMIQVSSGVKPVIRWCGSDNPLWHAPITNIKHKREIPYDMR